MDRAVYYCYGKQAAVLYERTKYWKCMTQREREEIIAFGDFDLDEKKTNQSHDEFK